MTVYQGRKTDAEKQKEFKKRIKDGEIYTKLSIGETSDSEKEWIRKQNYIRSIVSPCYDMQKYRIELGNRICMSTYNKLGYDSGVKIKDEEGNIIQKSNKCDILKTVIDTDETQENDENISEVIGEIKTEEKKINFLNYLTKEYKRITDGFVKNKIKIQKMEMRPSEIITLPGELIMIDHYISIDKSENAMFKLLKLQLVPTFGKPADWLLSQYGVGEKLAGMLLAYLNPYNAPHPSSFHAYCGFSVETDGKATSMSDKVLKEYIDKKGNVKIKESIKFNKDLKSKLVTCFKQNFIKKTSPWRKRYEEVRNRYDNRPDLIDKEYKNRRFKMALRVIIKEFLTELWIVMRTDQNLPVTPPITYGAAKLGLADHYEDMLNDLVYK